MDITKVVDRLYVASMFYPDWAGLPEDAVVIDCTTLYDDHRDQSREIRRLAGAVTYLHQLPFNIVLRCRSGRNRSCVVAARVLMMEGATAQEAIHIIDATRGRALKGGALTNQAFVGYLRSSGKE